MSVKKKGISSKLSKLNDTTNNNSFKNSSFSTIGHREKDEVSKRSNGSEKVDVTSGKDGKSHKSDNDDIFNSTGTSNTKSDLISQSSSTIRSDMSQDEEISRANRFKKQIQTQKRSMYEPKMDMILSKGDSTNDFSDINNDDNNLSQSYSLTQRNSESNHSSENPILGIGSNNGSASHSSKNASTRKFDYHKVNNNRNMTNSSPTSAKNHSKHIGISSKYPSNISNADVEEVTNELSMEDFERMMDTLSMQPKKHHSKDEDDDEDDYIQSSNNILSIEGFHTPLSLKNNENGVAIVYHSEQGLRHSQEDRCQIIPNLSHLKSSLSDVLNNKDVMKKFSIGCIFDGHNGWRCAQYLNQHFLNTLVSSDRFLDSRTMEVSLKDTFIKIDEQICSVLRNEEDMSGSTGSVIVYDGRKQVLTIATLGDSICVISRASKAVVLNKMHRLDNIQEKERVEKAGGFVANHRINGLLAISRAFGDIQFKEFDTITGNVTQSGLVISIPEIYAEKITPMTEFAIVASDGLWDVMSPQKSVDFVRSMLNKKKNLQEVVKDLTLEAINRGSIDNVTVLIMTFNNRDLNNNSNNSN
eukprot:gene4060-5803_t